MAEQFIAIPVGAAANRDCALAKNCFSPGILNVMAGTKVGWKNTDRVSHTITSGLNTDSQKGTIFDSGVIQPGNQFEFTFDNLGTYNFFCQIHPWLTGQVIVTTTITSNGSSGSISNSSGNSTEGVQKIPNQTNNALPTNAPPLSVTRPAPSTQSFPPPLRQFKSGIAIQDIKCVEGLQLVLKAEDNSPACVKAATALQLVMRGWAKSPNIGTLNNASQGDAFNKPGNILISDQFNNRVIEVNPATKDIVWSFGSGNASLCNPGPGAIIGTNDAERLSNGLTLIAGTGLPTGASDSMPKGCIDNRVIVVNQAGQIVWQYGQAGVNGSGSNMLNVPVFAIQLPNHDFLITDQGNNRIIEVNQTKQIVWSYGPASGPGALKSPNSAELLLNGNILIADENNNRAIEITRDGNIVWQYNNGVQTVAFASRLPNGNTLIVDSGNSRVLEVNTQNDIVFQFFTNSTSGSNPSPLPANAVRLENGNTIIADQVNERVLIIDSKGNTVFQYGKTNMSGVGPDQLNWPYTAFVIGDYTGQTPPP
jgi:plastocyanin